MVGKASQVFLIQRDKNTPMRIPGYFPPTKRPKNVNINDKAQAIYSQVTKIIQKHSSGDKPLCEKWERMGMRNRKKN